MKSSSLPVRRSGSRRNRRNHWRPSRERQAFRAVLAVEQLEDRCLLSNFTLGPLVQVAPNDPFAGCNVSNQVGVYFPTTQVEPRVAVDPTNPDHLVGVWQQDRWDDGGALGIVAGVSFNSGHHWTQVVIPGISGCAGGPFDRASDPWVSFGPNGEVFVSSLGIDGNIFQEAESAVLVSRSTDGGLTWSQPATLIQSGSGILNDKESITADPHNPNLVYVVWDQPAGLSSNGLGQTFFSGSTDGGQTWSMPQVIFQSPTNDTSVDHQIVVLPNGTLVDAFDEVHFDPTTFTTTYLLDIVRSSDGGLTWSQATVAAQQMPDFVVDPFNGDFVRSGGSLPEVAVDPNSGNLYAVWEDARFSNFAYESIAFSMSSDGGLTWSSPLQVNQTPVSSVNPHDSQALTPSVAVGADGTVAVSYYDFRLDGSIPGAGTDSWVVFGNPNLGLTNPSAWGNELRLTRDSFNLLSAPQAFGRFLGDYEGLASNGSNFEAFYAQGGDSFPQSSIFSRQILDGSGDPPATSSGSPSKATTSSPATSTPLNRPALFPAKGMHSAVLQSLLTDGFSTSPQASSAADPSGFLAPVSYAVGSFPVATAVGDLNHDGIPDLVVANEFDGTVSVLLGNGDGTFQPAQTYTVGNFPTGVALGDFNGDGNLDIVTATLGVTILFGNGDGTFQPEQTIPLPNVIANQEPLVPFVVAVGDVDNDGTPDIVVGAVASDFNQGYVVTMLGNGDGTFQPGIATPINSDFPTGTIALADFNGDGNLDVVTNNSFGFGRISVLLGKGDGTFQERSDPNTGLALTGSSVAVGDLNNDGIPDLVANGQSLVSGNLQGTISVLLGQGNGSFQAPQILLPGGFPEAVNVGDFNGDGNLDIVTANDTSNFPSPGTVSVFLGNGDGTFQAPLNFPSGAVFPTSVAVADFNHDGFPDLAVTDGFSNTVEVLINSATWPATTSALSAPTLATATSLTAVTAPATPLPAGPDLLASGAQMPSSAMLSVEDVAVLDQLFASGDWWSELSGQNADPLSPAKRSRFGPLG